MISKMSIVVTTFLSCLKTDLFLTAVIDSIAQNPMKSLILSVKMNGTMKTVDNSKTQSIKTMVANM